MHAFCLMTTHFHLLVESPEGELSEAMRVVENTYSRRFNRLKRRDGPLVRARFLSKRVRTEEYRRAVVRYIDRNPVRARLVVRPEAHEFCSARNHMSGTGRPWLERSWVARQLAVLSDREPRRAQAYRRVFGGGVPADDDSLDRLVEERLRSNSEIDPLDDLLAAKPTRIRAWLKRKARLADGDRIGLPVCGPVVLASVLQSDVEKNGPWYLELRSNLLRCHDVARVALLRDLCAVTWDGVVDAADVPLSRARLWRRAHDRLLEESEEYAARVSSIAQRAILETVGAGSPRAATRWAEDCSGTARRAK